MSAALQAHRLLQALQKDKKFSAVWDALVIKADCTELYVHTTEAGLIFSLFSIILGCDSKWWQ